MQRRHLSVLAAGTLAAALALSATPPAPVAAGPLRGPSGLPAVQLTVPAGQAPRIESEPAPTSPDAAIADTNTVADSLRYATQASSLPLATKGAFRGVGPFGQDDPASYPTGGLRFARGAGMGVSAAVDTHDPSGNTVYTGTIGGLWRSTDGGTRWTVLGDGAFARAGVGAVALDPAHPGDIYAGTGTAFFTSSGDFAGAGVYVSHDKGAHWTRPVKNVLGYGSNAALVTPSGTLVGTTKGLWLTKDRGASFSRVSLPSGMAGASSAGVFAEWITAIVANPRNPREVTVAIGHPFGKRLGPDGKPLSPGNGLYRSTTGAAGPYTRLAGTTGLRNPSATSDPLGRIVLAYGGLDTEVPVLWALVSDAGLVSGQQPAGLDVVGSTTGKSLNATNTNLNGLYRSDDDGVSWNVKATPSSLATSPNDGLGVYPALGYGIGVQSYYNLWVTVDPRNSSQVFFGLEEVFQSVSGTGPGAGLGSFEVAQKYWDVCGSTTYLENVYTGTACPDGTPYYGGPATHPDQHVGVATKLPNGKIRLYTGNDGGYFRQDSHALPDGRDAFDQDTWKDMNHLSSSEPYRVARTPAGQYLTALQDNGGGFFNAGGSNTLVTSGDGVFAIATSNPDVFYLSAQGAILWVTKDRGKTITDVQPDLTGAAFLSPIAIDPLDENHLVAAGQDVQETTKGPATQTILDPVAYTVVTTDWTSSFDAGTSPYLSPTTGKPVKWAARALAVRGPNVYAAVCASCSTSLASPTFVHATVATNTGKPGCAAAKQSAACWHLAAGKGLPHALIHGIAIDPKDVKTVYVALAEGINVGYDQRIAGSARVMVSHDAGEHFVDLTGNLPHASYRDVVVRNGQLIVAGDFGVFTAPAGTSSWKRLAAGLPQVRIVDLDLDRSGRYLTVAAYGRGVWVLDFQAPAASSSTGPGPVAKPPTKTPLGGSLAATGLPAEIAWLASGLLLLGLLLVRRRRAG